MFLNTFLWEPELTHITAPQKGCLLGNANNRGMTDLAASSLQVWLGEHEFSSRPTSGHANWQSHFFGNNLVLFVFLLLKN